MHAFVHMYVCNCVVCILLCYFDNLVLFHVNVTDMHEKGTGHVGILGSQKGVKLTL